MSTPPVPTATPVHAAIARYRQAQQALHDARQAERDAHDLVTAAEDTSALAAGNTALGDARQAVLVATNDVRQADLARSAALATTNAILSQRIRLLAANSRLPGLFDEDLKRLVGFLHQPTFAHAANLAESIGFTAETMLALRGIWREHQGRAEGTARFESISKIVAGNTFWDVVRDMEDLDDHHFMLALEVWVVSHRRVASPAPDSIPQSTHRAAAGPSEQVYATPPPSYEESTRNDGASQTVSKTGSDTESDSTSTSAAATNADVDTAPDAPEAATTSADAPAPTTSTNAP